MFFNTTKKNKAINVNEIDQLLGEISLIDIRETYEYEFGHIKTAKNIPMNTLLSNPGQYLDKNKEVYIICQSGARSSMACNYLLGQGYQVVNVVGGTGSYFGELE